MGDASDFACLASKDALDGFQMLEFSREKNNVILEVL